MKDGYIKVAAATPKVKVADTVYNGQLIKALMKECTDNGAKVVVFATPHRFPLSIYLGP